MILRSRVVRTLLYSFGAVAVAVGAVVLWQWRQVAAIVENSDVVFEGAEWANRVDTPEHLTAYIAAHRDDVSLAFYEVGRENEGLFLNAETPRALASTMKILVLSAWARAVEEGAANPDERIPLSEWEAFYLPATDGGAHPSALQDLEARKAITDETVSFRDVVRAMILYSDNAATDTVLFRLGQSRVQAEPAALEARGEEAPFPISGAMLLSVSPPDGTLPRQWIDACAQKGRPFVAAEAWRYAQKLRDDASFRQSVRASMEQNGIGLNLREQMAFADQLVVRGTARGYARIMERVVSAPTGSKWAYLMADMLEWPMRRGGRIASEFERFGTKGGSLPGVLTSATFATPNGKRPRVLALFFAHMPFAVYAQLTKTYAQQDFERTLLRDDSFVEDVRRAVTSAPVKADAQR